MVRKIKKRSERYLKTVENINKDSRRKFLFSADFWLLIASASIGCAVIVTSVWFLVKNFVKMFGGF